MATLAVDTGFPSAAAPPPPAAPAEADAIPGIPAMPGIGVGVVPPFAPAPEAPAPEVAVALGAYAGAAACEVPSDPPPQAARPGMATARTATANSRRGRRIAKEDHIG
ncbi:hypothetical protein; putative signal peptide [Frankia alni ACN14a]|uniref:Uncharacterized protein n=1 Tax=Frankia alni (strain DSM 45986 / CECT 9034 / ACN14a) TaxID=326424 RepID=Q0RIA7_FRAAA|nr:hypothetical protein; putative signal peptide [Frankia alni ACN14a]